MLTINSNRSQNAITEKHTHTLGFLNYVFKIVIELTFFLLQNTFNVSTNNIFDLPMCVCVYYCVICV